MRLQVIAVVVPMLATLGACNSQPLRTLYRPFLYVSVPGVSNDLQVFPTESRSFRVSLPFSLGYFSTGSDGRTLYAEDMYDVLGRGDPRYPRHPGLFRIDLDPIHVTSVTGSLDFVFKDLTVSNRGDRLLISGGRPGPVCGVFELTIPDGKSRLIAKLPSCDGDFPWRNLSISTDGVRATGTLHEKLYLINMTTGDVALLRDGAYVNGAWSPDGKWLAVIEATTEKTKLLDARTLEEKKTLGRTSVKWSPDSEYLLAVVPQLICGLSEAQTLEIVNVNTGVRTQVASSICQIDRSTTGWISSEAARKYQK